MEQEPRLENENLGAEMLENPPQGDYLAGLKAFVDWAKEQFAKL